MKPNINTIFKAIADPTRREIFHALVVASVAMSINTISKRFDITRQGVTKHIKTLEDAGLVRIESKGRERFCSADPNPLKEIDSWVQTYEKFWDNALDRLGNHLDKKG